MSLKKIIGLIVIILIIVIGVFVFSQSSKKVVEKSPQLDTVVKQIISSYLKSPGSAQFLDLVIKPYPGKESKYIAFGDVDSQNGFGALLRSHIYLTIFDKGGDKQNVDNWTVDELDLDNTAIVFNGKLEDTPYPLSEEVIVAYKQLEDLLRGQK